MGRITLAALAVFAVAGGSAAAAEYHARPADATLKDVERTYPRVGLETDWNPTHVVGERRYRVASNTVTDVTGPDKSKQRRVSAPQGYLLRWLGTAEGVAFLVAEPDRRKLDWQVPHPERRFYRLDLESMKWLEPFELPEPSIKPTGRQETWLARMAEKKPATRVRADRLLVTPRGVVVLCTESAVLHDARSPAFDESVLIGYHVTCYPPKNAKAKWDRTIRNGNRNDDGLYYDDSIEHLTYIPGNQSADLFLVCPSERDAIVCLEAASGKVRWRMPAIWEYERGYIGPSVFEHYIERFGLDYTTVQSAEDPVLRGDEEKIDPKELRERIRWKLQASRKLAAARKAFYARYEGRITGGPIVVPGTSTVYVAATRSLKPEPVSSDQPEHAFVYELQLDGDRVGVNAMTRLPRPVIGRPFRASPGGLVLACDRGGLVRLRTYEHDWSCGFVGPGLAADDLLLQIDWYREYLIRCPSAWLTASPATDAAGFSKARLFRPAMGYVLNKGDDVYQLQINIVDLRTGLDRDLTLAVPFAGSLPEGPLSSFNRGQPSERLYTNGPHAIWIDRLGVEGDRLTVVVADGSERAALTFDLSAILADERASEGE